MNVLDLLKKMEQCVLDIDLIDTIIQFYNADQACFSVERNYAEALSQLEKIFSSAQKSLFSELEALYAKNRGYSATYGFKCGILGGFKQFFTKDADIDGGFQKILCNDMMIQPKMQRHHDSYARNSRCDELISTLSENMNDSAKEHLTSIACAWDNRIYNAALHGFYCGYRAAFHIIDCVEPRTQTANISRILTTEFALGFIKPYSSSGQDDDNTAA